MHDGSMNVKRNRKCSRCSFHATKRSNSACAGSFIGTRPVFALLTIHVALLAWGGWMQSPTFDEVGHIGAGVSLWHFGRFELYRVNPPLRHVGHAAGHIGPPRDRLDKLRSGQYGSAGI